MCKLAIFDLDGTLYDTEKVNFSAYKKALSEVGCELDEKYFIKYCDGRHYKDFLPQILNHPEICAQGGTVEKVHNLKKQYYADFLGEVRENTFLFEMIKKMKTVCHIAMVTTASRKNVEDILSYTGKKDLFELVICQEDVVKKKPDPEGLFKAMEYFRLKPSDTVIFEDSDVGMEAAMASGASVMKVCRF